MIIRPPCSAERLFWPTAIAPLQLYSQSAGYACVPGGHEAVIIRPPCSAERLFWPTAIAPLQLYSQSAGYACVPGGHEAVIIRPPCSAVVEPVNSAYFQLQSTQPHPGGLGQLTPARHSHVESMPLWLIAVIVTDVGQNAPNFELGVSDLQRNS